MVPRKMQYVPICIIYLLFFATRVVTSVSSMPETFEEQRAIKSCDYFKEQAHANLELEGNLRCITTTESDTKLDKSHLTIGGSKVYTTYKGLTDYETKFCYSLSVDDLKVLDIKFSNDDPTKVARYEFTSCRAGGFWTNGIIFCEPEECKDFINRPADIDYFHEKLDITINMDDVNSFPDDTLFIKFMGSPDDRLVYDIQANTTNYYTTQEFLDLCKSEGGCFKGRFGANDNLLYSYGGRPPMAMKKMGDKVILGLRYDPRPFVFPEKLAPRRCRYEEGKSSDICDSPSGVQAWQILWESQLPYAHEWLELKFDIYWSHTNDCKIKVYNGNNILVDFVGPCGRYSDMKLGNYPFPKIGIMTGSGVGDHQMRFRNIHFEQNLERL